MPEMGGCDKTAPQITDICAKQEKVISENVIIIKQMSR